MMTPHQQEYNKRSLLIAQHQIYYVELQNSFSCFIPLNFSSIFVTSTTKDIHVCQSQANYLHYSSFMSDLNLIDCMCHANVRKLIFSPLGVSTFSHQRLKSPLIKSANSNMRTNRDSTNITLVTLDIKYNIINFMILPEPFIYTFLYWS